MPFAEQATLEQVLAARDNRSRRQSELIVRYGLPLICLTVNAPGSWKNSPAARQAFRAGCSELLRQLALCGVSPVLCETSDSITGCEAFLVVNMHETLLKELTVQIENAHPLGRLLDYDVIGRDGMAISRVSLGYPARKCLLCGEPAHACARNQTHSMEELHNQIDSMIELYHASARRRSS